MNLTPSLRRKIVAQFVAGHDIGAIANWYVKSPGKIEDILREALKGMAEAIVTNNQPVAVVAADTNVMIDEPTKKPFQFVED